MKVKALITPACLLFVGPLLSNSAVAQGLSIDPMTVVADNSTIAQAGPAADMPMGQGPSGTDGSLLPEDDMTTGGDEDLFGTKGGGYIHPFLSINTEYTDNLFNINTNEQTNWLTTIDPGIWLAIPRTKEVPLAIAPTNSTAGGLQMALPQYQGFERYSAYMMGALSYRNYSYDSDLNDYDANVEGFFKLNLRSGLSFQVIDHFTRSQDRFDVGASTVEALRRYYSNIALGDILWDVTEKISLKAEVSNFYLDYKEIDDSFLNRDDDTLSLYGYYKFTLRTSFFLEYRYIDVQYDDTLASFKDNTQDYFYGGINWIASAKTSFLFKLGYQQREYDNEEINTISENSETSNNDGLSFELGVLYQVTDKTKISLAAHQAIGETDSTVALDKKVFGTRLGYEQEFFENFIGKFDLSYENSKYNQLIGIKRDDDRFTIRPALQYVFSDWLMAELAYKWDDRTSTDDIFDYSSNTISFSLNSAL